jgi:formate hydrogenlyase transcriptional activator
VITARGGRLNLDRALPPANPPEAFPSGGSALDLLTGEDLERLERENLRRALERTGWQISGEAGAARLLGIAPSTLSSRMKALGVRRPT